MRKVLCFLDAFAALFLAVFTLYLNHFSLKSLRMILSKFLVTTIFLNPLHFSRILDGSALTETEYPSVSYWI